MAKTDKKTLDLIKEVSKRKAEISKLEKPTWRTNCAFAYVEGNAGNTINLQVVSSVDELIRVAAFLRERERSYSETAVVLGVENAPSYKWGGFSLVDWLEDIKTRINKIQISTKKKKLEELESRLNAIISPELRAELELQAIESELL